MLMNKIGVLCGLFNCVKVYWSVYIIVNVIKKMLEIILVVFCWIVKIVLSFLVVKCKFVCWEL